MRMKKKKKRKKPKRMNNYCFYNLCYELLFCFINKQMKE